MSFLKGFMDAWDADEERKERRRLLFEKQQEARKETLMRYMMENNPTLLGSGSGGGGTDSSTAAFRASLQWLSKRGAPREKLEEFAATGDKDGVNTLVAAFQTADANSMELTGRPVPEDMFLTALNNTITVGAESVTTDFTQLGEFMGVDLTSVGMPTEITRTVPGAILPDTTSLTQQERLSPSDIAGAEQLAYNAQIARARTEYNRVLRANAAILEDPNAEKAHVDWLAERTPLLDRAIKDAENGDFSTLNTLYGENSEINRTADYFDMGPEVPTILNQ